MTVTMLIDNDVVIKLAQMDAYTDAMAAVAASPGQIASLPVMLRFMGISDEAKRLKLTRSKQEADRLNAVLQSIVKVEMTDDEARTAVAVMKASLNDGLDLQEGELTLCVIAALRSNVDFCTGDKRAIRDLPPLEALWPKLSALRGKVLCLELLFSKLCEQLGATRARKAVATSRTADQTLTFVYDWSTQNGLEKFSVGLALVIKEHIEQFAPGWLKRL